MFNFIFNLFSKGGREKEFSFTRAELGDFFKPINKRGKHNHGLIACFNSFGEENANFLMKYTDEAKINGIIAKQYLDSIPQDKYIMKRIDRMLNESEDYRYGSFFLKFFPNADLDVLRGILDYAYKMLTEFSYEYMKNFRPGDCNTYMNEGWYIIGQYLQKYDKIFKLIPKAKKTVYPFKFLYYGRPNIAAYLFFYILVKNYCDVVVVSQNDYDYVKATCPYISKWIKYNSLIDSFEGK